MIETELIKKYTGNLHVLMRELNCIDFIRHIIVDMTLDFLKDAPLDLVDWEIDHTIREDVHIVRSPVLEEIQISELPPASERATVRWDKNPWAAVQGNPSIEREPVFWLWPYWMCRYLGIIRE